MGCTPVKILKWLSNRPVLFWSCLEVVSKVEGVISGIYFLLVHFFFTELKTNFQDNPLDECGSPLPYLNYSFVVTSM